MISTETWNAIGKYGFATVVATVTLFYYRVDVVVPQREQSAKLIQINEQQAETQYQQTEILENMAKGIEDIKQDQRRFPAVAERRETP